MPSTNPMPHKTLILKARDIERLVDMRNVLRIVEEAFRLHGYGRVKMPPKIYIHLEKYRGDFRAMPAYIEGPEACGIKWVNVHPENRRRNLPTVIAVIILSDPGTGLPLAVMDGTHITNMRTGAAGGIAAKYLANKDSSSVGLAGCGVQAIFQLLALNTVFTLKDISVYDTDRKKASGFIAVMARLGIDAEIAATAEECVSGRDIVVTTTPSRKPVIKSAWISPGTHINAIGADARGKEELDPAILKKARIFVDDMAQASHSGEINVPISKRLIRKTDVAGTLGQVICRKRKGRTSARDITVFDSTGLAIQDIAVADHVYKIIKDPRRRRRCLEIDFRN